MTAKWPEDSGLLVDSARADNLKKMLREHRLKTAGHGSVDTDSIMTEGSGFFRARKKQKHQQVHLL